MKKLIYLYVFCFQANSFAQDAQSQIDSIMTLYPNCADYPTSVLIQLDSLLVVIELEESTDPPIDLNVTIESGQDTTFFNYLDESFPNLIQDGIIDAEVASTITELNLDNLGIENIDGIELFCNLEYLSCENNHIQSFPSLPDHITTLYAKWNSLVEVFELPPNIVNIDLRHNSLNSLGQLPVSIKSLKLCFNDLTSLPMLPDSLEILFCAYNNLTSLPAFPNKVEQVLCYGNQISEVDLLPESIEVLRIQNNDLFYLPDIPESMTSLNVDNNPIVCIKSYPIQFEEILGDFPTCIEGCINPEAVNFFLDANLNNGSCEYLPTILWPDGQDEINTGTNATYIMEELIRDGSTTYNSFQVGAFYPNPNGGLNCGGFSNWSGGLGSVAVYADDLTTEEKDGFSQGDQIIWLVRESNFSDTTENYNYIAHANYISGSDFYVENSINLANNFTFFSHNTALTGCTNDIALNYDLYSTIDDSSCVFQHEIDLADLMDSIMSLQSELLSLQTDTINLAHYEQENAHLQASIETWDISLILPEGWNMIGYGCPNPIEVSEAFSAFTENIVIVKNNNGAAYLPEFNFNGIEELLPGQGYQIKVSQEIVNLSLCGWYISEILEGN